MSSFEGICRVCVQRSQTELTLIEDLIEYHEKKMSVKDVLRFFIPNELLMNKDYPQIICEKCLSVAKIVFAFKVKCDESHILLQDLRPVAKNIQDDTLQTANEPEVKQELFELTNTEIYMENYNYEGTNCLHDNDNRTKEQVYNKGEEKIKDEIPVNEQMESSDEKNCFLIKIQDKMEKVYYCPRCPKSFKRINNLKAHKKRHDLKGRFRCNLCGKGFYSNSDYNRHVRTHTGEKDFECNICLKRFITANVLNLHVRAAHTEDRPYACDVCSKKFVIQCHLDRHKKTHSGERPFMCSQCSKTFIQKIDVQRHEAIHKGEKPFGCNVCDMRFLRKVHLDQHMMLHTEERPHVCPYCDKGFIRAYFMKDHISKHHPQPPVIICDVDEDVKPVNVDSKLS